MSSDHIDKKNLQITGRHSEIPAPHVDIDESKEGIVIIVRQAFGPKGDNLVGFSDVTFDGHPAITLLVRLPDGREGEVHLSPIHGDRRKEGMLDIEKGTRCELLCPVSKEPLPEFGEIEASGGARYRMLFLTPKLNDGAAIMVSDTWGHYHSRVVDEMELLSQWAAEEL